MSLQSRFAALARDGGRGALVTVMQGGTPGAKLLVLSDGATEGSLGDSRLDAAATAAAGELIWAERSERREQEDVTYFVDVVAPPPRLIAFGAVNLAADLCRVGRTIGWRTYVVDPRERFATPERFPDAEEVLAAWPQEALERLGGIDPATSIAVLTHDPKLDDAALGIALRSPAGYVGALGSRRTQERRRERLLAGGITEEELARLSAPIGLDLGSASAAETALAIMAEVVAVRHGHQGGRLTHSQGRIHEAA